MIKNFEEITFELTDKELATVPLLIWKLREHGKLNPIKAPAICFHFDISQPRLRKMINYIRSKGMLYIIATSKVYYVSKDRAEIKNQIDSLKQRANSILRCAKGMEVFLNDYQQKLFND